MTSVVLGRTASNYLALEARGPTVHSLERPVQAVEVVGLIFGVGEHGGGVGDLGGGGGDRGGGGGGVGVAAVGVGGDLVLSPPVAL